MTVPIIRIEIESMKHAIAHAMTDHFAEMDAGVQEALEAACKNFDYRAAVLREANRCIEAALSEAISRQFRYGGAGYEAVQSVAAKLAESALKNIADPSN